MKIGIDLDNVVVELTKGFCDFYNLKNKGKIKPENFEGYYLHTFLPISKEEEYPLWKEYHDSDFFDEMELIENAKEIIDVLKKEHELIFITARNPGWKEKTERFFKKYFPEDDFKLIFSGEIYGGGKLKDEICKELDIKLIIEDNKKKSIDYAEKGIKVLLLDKVWNKNCEHENIKRVADWGDILENIKLIGVEDG